MSVIPRGIRNNNPGNVRKDGTVWQGMSPTQDDPEFIVFMAPQWGIRAITRIIRHYKADGLNTISQLVNRWAPAIENDTVSYCGALSVACEVGITERIDYDAIMPGLIKAIIRHENGMQPYDDSTIQLGISLA